LLFLGLVKKLGFVLVPARTRLARKQNAGLLVGSPSFADTASRSRSQPKMEDNLFTSPYKPLLLYPAYKSLSIITLCSKNNFFWSPDSIAESHDSPGKQS